MLSKLIADRGSHSKEGWWSNPVSKRVWIYFLYWWTRTHDLCIFNFEWIILNAFFIEYFYKYKQNRCLHRYTIQIKFWARIYKILSGLDKSWSLIMWKKVFIYLDFIQIQRRSHLQRKIKFRWSKIWNLSLVLSWGAIIVWWWSIEIISI